MAYTQTVAPASEPVTLAEAKAHCRVDTDTENTLITALITAARETAEAETGRQLISATWTLKLDEFPEDDGCIELRHPPLSSVTSIVYLDADGASQTLSASAYQVDTAGTFGRIVLAPGETWPTTEADRINAVTITFVAGYTTVPETLKLAIKLMVGHWFENREETCDRNLYPVPMAAKALFMQNWCGEY